MSDTIQEANEIHAEAFAEMVQHSDPPVVNTPLSPMLPYDLLADRHAALDGSKIRCTRCVWLRLTSQAHRRLEADIPHRHR